MGLLETGERLSPAELFREPIIHPPCQLRSQYDNALKKACQVIQHFQQNQGGPSQFQPAGRYPMKLLVHHLLVIKQTCRCANQSTKERKSGKKRQQQNYFIILSVKQNTTITQSGNHWVLHSYSYIRVLSFSHATKLASHTCSHSTNQPVSQSENSFRHPSACQTCSYQSQQTFQSTKKSVKH